MVIFFFLFFSHPSRVGVSQYFPLYFYFCGKSNRVPTIPREKGEEEKIIQRRQRLQRREESSGIERGSGWICGRDWRAKGQGICIEGRQNEQTTNWERKGKRYQLGGLEAGKNKPPKETDTHAFDRNSSAAYRGIERMVSKNIKQEKAQCVAPLRPKKRNRTPRHCYAKWNS